MDINKRLVEGSMAQEQRSTGSGRRSESEEHAEAASNNCYHHLFSKSWPETTSDNRLTLFGFRRFRTTHLLNLRLLEAEIDKIDHDLYQAGLQLNQSLDREHSLDRLGLKQAKRDCKPMKVEEVVNEDLILRLRGLIKEYGKWIFERSLDSLN
jgi:hypothetical protein